MTEDAENTEQSPVAADCPNERLVMPDFSQLAIVNAKAAKAGVGYAMHFCEADNSYYFSVQSAAPSEEWVGKNHSFEIAVECVCEWLDSLKA